MFKLKLKMPLDKKLFGSYIIVILIAVMTSFTLFSMTVNQFFIFRLRDSMERALAVIKEDISGTAYYIPDYNSESSVLENTNDGLLNLVHAELLIFSADGKTVRFSNRELLTEFVENWENWSYLENKYLIISGTAENASGVYHILLISSDKGLITELNHDNLSVLFISSLVSMVIATFFGVYAQNNISRPIRILKEKVNDFREDLIQPQNTIFTGDELQELDENLVLMATDIITSDKKRKAFFENTSHELKTPLMSINGYAEGLKDGIFTVEEAADIILSESESLRAMVEQILYLSKLEDATLDRYHWQNLDINDFLEGFYHKMLGIVKDQGLELKLFLDKNTEVSLDDEKMIRALSNVITNGVRYAKTKITIRTRLEPDFLNIMISNDGPPVDEEKLPLLFDRFFKGDKGQSGLGLAIVEKIITDHHGTVQAKNTEEGFCLQIRLPYRHHD